MKRIVILLAALLFIACLIIGLQIGDTVFPKKTATVPTATRLAQAARQQNILLFYVDSFEPGADPNVLSVWVLFIYHGNPNSVIFMPVYQSGKAENSDLFAKPLPTGPDGLLPPDYVQKLEAKLQINTAGYMLMDQDALGIFRERYARTGSGDPLNTMEDLENLCHRSGVNNAAKLDIPWSQIVPSHFRTNMNFTDFMAEWVRMTQSETPPHCEVSSK